MRTGILGGTFNPVHNGHVRLAETYFSALHLDRLLVIPTKIPPHKSSEHLADASHRLAMCKLAFAGMSFCTVSDIELNRGNPSYTVDTLKQLSALHPKDRFYLIVGSDMFCSLTEWHDWQQVIQFAVICAGARKSVLTDGHMEEQRRMLETLGAHCELVEFEPLPISSTMVREKVCRGETLDGLVSPPVAAYIQRHGLYR